MKYLLLLLLSVPAKAAPLVQPQDVAFSSFSIKGLSIGTTTVSTTALNVYGVIASSSPVPSVTCTSGSPTMTAGSGTNFGSYAAGALATGCTVTFAAGFGFRTGANVFCFCQAFASLAVWASAASPTAVTCTSATAMTGDTVGYWCWGQP